MAARVCEPGGGPGWERTAGETELQLAKDDSDVSSGYYPVHQDTYLLLISSAPRRETNPVSSFLL